MIDVITCRGTGEPLGGGSNMLSYVTRGLDSGRFNLVGDLFYPAAVSLANRGGDPFGPSENTSIRIGVGNLAQLIRSTPNKVGLIGYSLGALVVTAFREAQTGGEYLDCEIEFSACIANTRRTEGDSIDSGSAGFGIDGRHGPFPCDSVHFEAANPADVITSCQAGSPLRTLADQVSAFSVAELGWWTQDLVDRLHTERFQPSTVDWWRHPIRTWQSYQDAAAGVAGYLTGKEHIHTLNPPGFGAHPVI